ncbi:MAG: TonB family protein [Alphaproteobacteria bacterium]|nr:TonB family protein [Alphaproteobacteria bacterium]MBL7097821.1 TonB family protein [Alphaproteobacteria bacterium]
MFAVLLFACAATPARAEADRPATPLGSHEAASFYPDGARMLMQEGDVVVAFTITAEGTVVDPKVTRSSGYALLDQAALAAVVTWRYTPALRDGKAVAVPHSAVVRFGLYGPDSIFGVGNALADDCSGYSKKPPALRIEACNQVLGTNGLDPGDKVVALRQRGVAELGLHKHADALTDLNAALALDPDDYRAMVDRGDVYLALHQYPRAMAEYDRALLLQPNNGFVYGARAYAHLQMGQYDAALKDVEEELNQVPGAPGTYVLRANIYRGMGCLDAALEDANKAIAIEPTFLYSWWARAQVYEAQHNYKGAIADYDHMISVHGEDPELLNDRCFARAEAGIDLDAALADCSRSLVLADEFETRDSRGLVYFRMGKYDLAIADLDIAISKGRNARSLYIRGLAKRKQGDSSGGGADIDLAKKLDPAVVSTFAGYGVGP